MLPLARSSRDPLVTLLSGYACGVLLSKKLPSKQAELIATSIEAKNRLSQKFTRAKWAKYVEEAKADMHVVILGKLIEEATSWLFADVESVSAR